MSKLVGVPPLSGLNATSGYWVSTKPVNVSKSATIGPPTSAVQAPKSS